jgi:hypothetical protein
MLNLKKNISIITNKIKKKRCTIEELKIILYEENGAEKDKEMK